MTGNITFNNMNKGNVLIYFLYIHLMFYKKKNMIESLESRLVFLRNKLMFFFQQLPKLPT